jgi:hypothetical protein
LSVFGVIQQVTVVQFTICDNTSWQVQVATEIFASAENMTDEMLPAVMNNIVVLDGQGACTDCVS